MKINNQHIKDHLDFILNIDRQYDDGRFEVSGLNNTNTKNFAYEGDEQDINRHIEIITNSNKNIYIAGATLNPSKFMEQTRSNDGDFYASQFVWTDIDDEHDPEELKEKYKGCPPHFAVVTARVPHRRIQLWWRLEEAITDPDTIREALIGIAQNLGGDTSVINPTSLMRLGGTVNRPTEKKKAKGRVDEVTTSYKLSDKSVSIEQILATFPQVATYENEHIKINKEVQGGVLDAIERVTDGRDKYMSDMIYASILTLTEKHNRWPEAQEVFDDCWPTFKRKASERDGRSVEQDGHTPYKMAHKIKSKLRQFKNGFMAGFKTIDDVIAAGREKAETKSITSSRGTSPLIDTHKGEVVDPETGEVITHRPFNFIYFNNMSLSTNDNSLVQDVLNQEELSVVYGESNCGKTFFMLDMALHIARGEDWFEKRVVQGSVVYAALEGQRGFVNRCIAHREYYGLKAVVPLAATSTPLDFYSENANINSFIDCIKKEQDALGDPKLIVIDTLARALSGGDENSGQDMGRLVGYADLIRNQTKAHLSFVHHSGKDRALGARGHSSLRAAVDTEIEIYREKDANQSHIRFVKQREMEMIDDLAFELKSVVIGTNTYTEEIKSCVVIPVEAEGKKQVAPLGDMETFVYDCIIHALLDYGVVKSPEKDMSPQKVVTYEDFYEVLEQRGYKELRDGDGEVTPNNVKKSTNSVRIKLRKKNYISFNSKYIWQINREIE
jgi:hypothetical protein